MNHSGRSAYSALLLVLCGLYFVLAMGLTALSGGVYRSVAADADLHFTQRTALSYLVNQTRQCDLSGGVTTGTFDGSDALFLRDGGYVTILYARDGFLRELYMEDGLDLPSESGMEILPLAGLSLRSRDGLLTFTVSDEGGASWSASVRPRCGVEQEAAS